jgi:LPS sulfotransferase NodH
MSDNNMNALDTSVSAAADDDTPEPKSLPRPSLSYLICAAPRTGSTLLAQALAATGRAGRPNEYFDIHDENEHFWLNSLSIADDSEYFGKAVRAGTTANGVFAIKLLWHQSPAILAKLRAAAPPLAMPPGASLHQLLEARLGVPPRYVWLRRRDKLAQAISYLRASKTGIWRSTDMAAGRAAAPEPAFDFDLIAQYVRVVHDFDLRWEAYFRENRLKVLMIVYENFVQAYERTVFDVLDFIGVPRDGITLPPPRLQRQGDAASQDWQRQFVEIARKRGMVARRRRPALAADGAPAGVSGGAAPQTADEPGAARRDWQPARRKPGMAQEPPLPLIGYQLNPAAGAIVKAGADREWMDATAVRFAYRCLPMVIANQHGWLLLNKHKIVVIWNGGPDPAALKIQFLSGEEPRDAVSIFGSGILTFTIGYLFRTPPGYNLHVRGPVNAPKDGIVALEGIVESDWTEATFTMNWKVTRPNHPLVFEEGEPIAMISPLKRGEVERFRPELHLIGEDPELAALHREWAQSRARHNADLNIPDSQARKDGWQRHYVKGISIRKEPAREHQTKLAVAEFADKRQRAARPPDPA